MKIKYIMEQTIIITEVKEKAIHLLKKEVHIKEKIMNFNKKDLILKNLIYNLNNLILTRTDLNLKISIPIKVEECLFKLFNLSNLDKSKKTDFPMIETLQKNIWVCLYFKTIWQENLDIIKSLKIKDN